MKHPDVEEISSENRKGEGHEHPCKKKKTADYLKSEEYPAISSRLNLHIRARQVRVKGWIMQEVEKTIEASHHKNEAKHTPLKMGDDSHNPPCRSLVGNLEDEATTESLSVKAM